MFDIEEELKKLPESPGVYLMHSENDEIIYVGKAINLKRRVHQYFQSSRGKTNKILKMVSNIAWFEYIVTDSELEALILECNLIKEHRPRYNTMLMDDKSYPFIRVTVEEEYPRIMLAREMKKDKAKYFGPYTSSQAVKDIIDLLTKIYKIRTCSRSLPKDIGKGRPCLNYHIKQCKAPCMGYISKEEYKENMKSVIAFLNGNHGSVTKMLEEKMYEASEAMEFEEAATYRDLLNSVKAITDKQKITTDDDTDRDIIAYAMDGNDAVVQVFFVRGGKVLGREHFHLCPAPLDTGAQVLQSFIKQYYAGSNNIPKQILIPERIEDADIIQKWLSAKKESKVSIAIPLRGDKEKLVELAERNARIVLEQDKDKLKREERRTRGAMEEVCALIGIAYASRVEAYDISNTNGFESVGSMVVYEDGKPKRSDYRKFKIKTVKGPNDYASMKEVLTRRFMHGLKEKDKLENSFTKFPDLILMDGGRGQVNIALEVLKELCLDIPVCGMVKDDHHRTRGLYYQNVEIPIDTHGEAFRLITRVQDEAHRFAITFHKNLRAKDQIHSVLDDIEGIGPARRKALMKAFASMEAIREANIETLKNIPSMNEAAAQKVYEFFH